jgi:hypothetical protein
MARSRTRASPAPRDSEPRVVAPSRPGAARAPSRDPVHRLVRATSAMPARQPGEAAPRRQPHQRGKSVSAAVVHHDPRSFSSNGGSPMTSGRGLFREVILALMAGPLIVLLRSATSDGRGGLGRDRLAHDAGGAVTPQSREWPHGDGRATPRNGQSSRTCASGGAWRRSGKPRERDVWKPSGCSWTPAWT